MNWVNDPSLIPIAEKVNSGVRISESDAVALFASHDLHAIARMANSVAHRKNGNRASYIVNAYINYSNYCILSCQFCAFAKKKRDADGFELTIPQILESARKAIALGATELHIVGGLHPSLPFSHYTGMLQALRDLDPNLQLKCFTAVEILHLAWLGKRSVKQTLTELRDAGLQSLTGGGAEIFRKEVRAAIAKGKESAEEYLDVHRTWHTMGGRSTCTMLFGHVENHADRVDHLNLLRQLQDETHGFTGFVPLPYQPENNDIPVKTAPTGFDSLRTIAISRIFLDNFDHITAYWVGLGLKLAQVALSHGADDIHGTILEEKIFHMAGAKTPQSQAASEMIKAIREAGKDPFQRNTFYEEYKPVPRKVEPPREDKILREGDSPHEPKPAPSKSHLSTAQMEPRPPERSTPRFRIGSVPFLNAVPLTRGIEAEVDFSLPSELAQKLRQKQLDAALVSVTEVLFSGAYDILDGVAVASLGEVKSVFLAHRGDIGAIQEIHCDPASLTSVNLLKVLLAERGVFPKFQTLGEGETPDHLLLIGDRAIEFLRKPHDHAIWDLGAAWFELTQLPFVYAVWALQRGSDLRDLKNELRDAKRFGLDTLDHIIDTSKAFDPEFRRDYLTWHIHYHLGTDEKRGLAKFVELLRKHSLGKVHDPCFA